MDKLEKLKKACENLLILLNEDYDPHVKVIVTTSSIELLSGEISIPEIFDFVKD
jgi:intracellular sulfur oxidation DsrE/DsrF family protein